MDFHRELGALMWEYCGMARSAEGLKKALARIPELRAEFWENVRVPAGDMNLNQSLEYAGRVADFLEFAELMCRDALVREESCGGHYRVEHQVDGEANFSDHGANRLGASALMQGLADGYVIIPYTLGNYLAGVPAAKLADATSAPFKASEDLVKSKLDRLINIRGKRTVDSFHKELGHIMWEDCGMARSKESLTRALTRIPELREQFWKEATVLGERDSFNQSLEKAGRVADFLEFSELMCRDALVREESCGGHFRVEHQVEGEAKRDDENFCHAAVWEYAPNAEAIRHIEPLTFENVHLATRSYK
jgi:succinate dehydrogenase / fumarate reductase flavoprotein subunit